jgi:hypothetical protein
MRDFLSTKLTVVTTKSHKKHRKAVMRGYFFSQDAKKPIQDREKKNNDMDSIACMHTY